MKKVIVITNKYVADICGVIAGILSIVILAVILIQVVCRYIFLISTPWAEELARYAFVALVYIGGGVGVYTDSFVSVDLIDRIVDKSKNSKKIMQIISKCSLSLTILFLGYFISIYVPYLQKISKIGQYSAAMRMDMTIPMFFLLLGCLFMLFHAISRLIVSPEETEKILTEYYKLKNIKKANKEEGIE